MTKKQRTKLELIRIEGIAHMLIEKVDEKQLTNLYEHVTKVAPRDVRIAVKKLPRYQLIKIIEMIPTIITGDDIDKAYEQYRYGLKPGFTLFQVSSSCSNVTPKTAYNEIVSILSKISYGDEDGLKSIQATDHAKINDSMVEFSFSYLKKHSYLSESEEPSFVYEFEVCFAWMAVKERFLAIKNVPDKVLTILKRAFSETYQTQFTNIKLTKKLIKDIFGDDKMMKGSFINPNASQDQAEKMVISDSNLSKKQAVQNSLSEYNMTGTYIAETIGENSLNTLGINCDKGRLYLTRNVSATQFRTWSADKITQIISYLGDKADYANFDVFAAKNVMDTSMWKNLSKPQKAQIEKVCYSVYVATQNKQDSSSIDLSVAELRKTSKNFFYEYMQAYCEQCEEAFLPHCLCGSTDLKIIPKGKILCVGCGQEIEQIQCENGHVQHIVNPEDLILLYATAELHRNVCGTLKDILGVERAGSFYINNGTLTILDEKIGGLLNPSELPELRVTSDKAITQTDYDSAITKLRKINEKCSNRANNAKCNSCSRDSDAICIMKIFSTYPQYRPSPHNAAEFGDVSFAVRMNGTECQLVGIAKSAINGETLTRGDKVAQEMLQQILTATHDARAGIIAAICPMRFQDQLTEELRYVAQLTKKPIVILDDEFMTRQYLVFQEQQKSS